METYNEDVVGDIHELKVLPGYFLALIGDRKTYKEIKKYNREEMNNFLSNLYREGFREGTESGEQADFKIKLVKVLQTTKGIGDKTIAKVLKTLKEME